MRWTRLLALFLMCACAAPVVRSQASSGTSSAADGVYPNTMEGLQSLIGDIFQAAKEKNTAKETTLIQSLLMPENSTWFTGVYGPGFGASLAAAYERVRPTLQEEITTIYEADVERGWTNPQIVRYADPETVNSPLDHFLNSMNQIVPLYEAASAAGGRVSMMLSLKPGAKARPMAGDLDGYFIYDLGGFRFVPMNILLMLPSERPVRIQLDMNVMRSKFIKEVPVQIPQEAIQRHISGQVLVELVLDVNGNIKESKVLEGDPILAAAVMSAVKEWRFAPTKLDGDPVEVDFQVPYKFQIQ
ncbi:MAG TPA: energy transducer TonB [Candidatus Aquilonibacter sp.]|nr:energy transducer TonB [Candidatus Aquilonibacter sp.]